MPRGRAAWSATSSPTTGACGAAPAPSSRSRRSWSRSSSSRPTDPEAHLDARAWVERIVDDIDSEGLELLYRRYVLQESGKELADDLASSPAAMRMRLMRLRSSVSALAPLPRDALASRRRDRCRRLPIA